MHSTDGHTDGITFHHNGDYSGEIVIQIDDEAKWKYKEGPTVVRNDHNFGLNRVGYWTIKIPFEDLKLLVSDWVRSNKISKLEQAKDEDILLGKDL